MQVVDSGTVTTTGSSQTLSTQTGAGSYVLGLNLVNMALGNVLKVTITTKMLSGSTARKAFEATFSNAQNIINFYTIPLPVPHEIVASIQLTAGSNIDIEWSLMRL